MSRFVFISYKCHYLQSSPEELWLRMHCKLQCLYHLTPASRAFTIAFAFENASSTGFMSGESGGSH